MVVRVRVRVGVGVRVRVRAAVRARVRVRARRTWLSMRCSWMASTTASFSWYRNRGRG